MPKKRWNDDFYVRVYEFIRGGYSEKDTAKAMGITPQHFSVWKREKPALLKAIKRARAITKRNQKDVSFMDYVAHHIPPDLKRIWDKINEIDEARTGVEAVDALLNDYGDNVRQNIFLHALVVSNFKMNVAIRKAGISWGLLNRWKEDDPDFPQLIEYIRFLRKNFCEDALMTAIDNQEVPAIIQANQTLNSDRGYGRTLLQKMDLNVNAKVEHTFVHVEELLADVSLGTKKELLKALRKRKRVEAKQLEAKDGSN